MMLTVLAAGIRRRLGFRGAERELWGKWTKSGIGEGWQKERDEYQLTSDVQQRTRDDGEPAPQIRQPNLRDVEAINDDTTFNGVDETEERER